ncbi:MAG: SDR family NAD(P)-dependent oxidoreductase [Betaproteobacteria bacterium]|nr:SDR family NAD(P)-dependent oxidoreductase [Betaproteobacteria bacterium]
MIRVLEPPKRKNPVLRTRQPTLPPAARSRIALGLTAAAALGRFELQQCRDCGTVQYPPREACRQCLSIRLDWKPQPQGGELLSDTVLHHSNDLFFRERLPWRLGLVKLDCGPTVVAHLHERVAQAPGKVRVAAKLDRAGQAVMVALPGKEEDMAQDRQLREFTCDPKFRKVLVTDGKTAAGQALVKSLAAAGADLIWVGHAEPWKKFAGFDELEKIKQVTVLPLDVTDSKNVREVAAEIGGKVDILINNAEYHRAYGISNRSGVDTARAEMDVNYLGLLRLAQEFGPALRGRGADGLASATAWVNLLSIYALANFPSHGTFSASKAAAHSLSQCLRAEMRPAGVRVINVFPGPLDDEWNQLLPPPKVAPTALANAVIKALREGVEDVYPGDVAQEWLARWRDNPKALEKELST